ncbi:MAG TPA: two-component regulator propeller domain-containing protein [Steroidobacteraceae bacterium]|nr:two-component regulator propeller domain-containing protein [Steroidobacteraceae bacterium]
MRTPRGVRNLLAIGVLCIVYVPGSLAAVFGQPIANDATAPPQGLVERQVVRIPVVDSNDIRFSQLPTGSEIWQTRVSQIVQDDQGFIWLGTQYGLLRYDGYAFKAFTPDPARPGSISGVFIESLFKDRSGSIWVGSDQRLDRFDPSTETFKHFPLGTTSRSSIGVSVAHISEDAEGILWLSTGDGLFRLDPTSGQTRRFGHDPADPRSLSSSDIKSTLEDRSGRFWVATRAGIDALDRATGQVTLHVPMLEFREMSMLEDRAGTLWVLHHSGTGIAILDRKAQRLRHLRLTPPDGKHDAGSGVYAALEDREGTLWIGTGGGGLLRYERAAQRFVRYLSNPYDKHSLAGDTVVSLFEDREGDVWVSLHSAPLSMFARRHLPFEKLGRDPSITSRAAESVIGALFEDHAGQVWLSHEGFLSAHDRNTEHFQTYQVGAGGLAADVIGIAEHPAGTFWLGTVGGGLGRLDRSTGRFRYYRHDPEDPQSVSSDVVERILPDRDGSLWLATWDGLDHFDPSTGRFTRYEVAPDTRAQVYLDLKQDAEGYVWLGSNFLGLHRFDPSHKTFTVYAHEPDRQGSLSNNRVNSVLIDHSGTVWAGTQNGLNRFDPRAQTFVAYYTKDGLPGDVVSCILEDGSDHLWLSTNRGVARFDPVKKSFDTYSDGDGLPGNDLTGWGACYKSPSGEMYFGGFSGATSFHPDRITDGAYRPTVVLTDFELGGTPVVVGPHSVLRHAVSHTSAVTLPFEQSPILIEFAVLSFSSPAKNRYRYRLDGLDSQWHETASNRRVVSYTTLPAGSYRLRLQGATERGPWSEPETTMSITILPPWWQTWWLRTALIFTLAFAAVMVYLGRIRQLAHQFEIRLEERVSERTRIARDLHDSLLQGIQGLMFRLQAVLHLLPADPQAAATALEQALERGDATITEARDAVLDLRAGGACGSDLVEGLRALGEELGPGEVPGIPAYRVVVEGRPRALAPILRDEVYRIVREAFRNARRHSQSENIEVELAYAATRFTVRVRDDGIGLDRDVLERGARHGHWGLQGMRERATRLGGTLHLWSERKAGTEIEINVPGSIAYRNDVSETANISQG